MVRRPAAVVHPASAPAPSVPPASITVRRPSARIACPLLLQPFYFNHTVETEETAPVS
jgi:hypothetical protein